MITSAVVLSKFSTNKMFKPWFLCYWQVDCPYLETLLKHKPKMPNTKIFVWRNN